MKVEDLIEPSGDLSRPEWYALANLALQGFRETEAASPQMIKLVMDRIRAGEGQKAGKVMAMLYKEELWTDK